MDPAHGSSSVSGPTAPHLPRLRCACGIAASTFTSKTPRNPERRYLRCKHSRPKRQEAHPSFAEGCYLWIWEDLLNQYVEEMIKYHAANLATRLHRALGDLDAAMELQLLHEDRLARMDLAMVKLQEEALATPSVPKHYAFPHFEILL